MSKVTKQGNHFQVVYDDGKSYCVSVAEALGVLPRKVYDNKFEFILAVANLKKSREADKSQGNLDTAKVDAMINLIGATKSYPMMFNLVSQYLPQ